MHGTNSSRNFYAAADLHELWPVTPYFSRVLSCELIQRLFHNFNTLRHEIVTVEKGLGSSENLNSVKLKMQCIALAMCLVKWSQNASQLQRVAELRCVVSCVTRLVTKSLVKSGAGPGTVQEAKTKWFYWAAWDWLCCNYCIIWISVSVRISLFQLILCSHKLFTLPNNCKSKSKPNTLFLGFAQWLGCSIGTSHRKRHEIKSVVLVLMRNHKTIH